MKKIAVIIPSYNEEGYIEKCVRSLLNSSLPVSDFEIFVCDGKSEDETQKIVSQIAQKHANVHLLINQRRTTPFALNQGIKASSAKVKLILGAHSEVAEDFLENNLRALQDHPEAGCVGGVIENVYADENSKAIGLAMSSKFGVGNALFRTGAKKQYVDTVAFGAYRQEVFDAVGYFDEELTRNQDDEFNFRVTKAGFNILLDPAIKCKYFVRGTFSKLARQYFQYGYWKVFVNKKHRSFLSIRQLVPPLFLLYNAMILVIWLLPKYMQLLYATGLLLYAIMAIVFALKMAKGLKMASKVLWSFFILHESYGLGYLSGIKDFILLGRKPAKQTEASTR